MNACAKCVELDGQSSSLAPHANLEFKSELGTGVPPLTTKCCSKYRCAACGTWMHRYTETGELPNQWAARVQQNPVHVNGYLVYGEVFVGAKSELYEGAYEIRYSESDGRESGAGIANRASSGHRTPYSALVDALRLGVAHAKGLPTR